MAAKLPPEGNYVAADDVEPVELWPGIERRTLVWGERMLLAEIWLKKGEVVPVHRHPHEQIGYVATGKLKFTVGGVAGILGPRAAYIMPSNVEHSVEALEDSIAVDVFSPVRDEYMR